MADFFISYSRNELTFADSLYQDLKAQGLKVWMDIHHLQAGIPWQDQIFNALSEASTVLLIISKGIVESTNIQNEIARSQAQGKKIYLIIFEATQLGTPLTPSLTTKENSAHPTTSVDWDDIRLRPYVDFRQSYLVAFNRLLQLVKDESQVEIKTQLDSWQSWVKTVARSLFQLLTYYITILFILIPIRSMGMIENFPNFLKPPSLSGRNATEFLTLIIVGIVVLWVNRSWKKANERKNAIVELWEKLKLTFTKAPAHDKAPEHGFKMFPTAAGYAKRSLSKLIIVIAAGLYLAVNLVLIAYQHEINWLTSLGDDFSSAYLNIFIPLAIPVLVSLAVWNFYVWRSIRTRTYHYGRLIVGELFAAIGAVIIISLIFIPPNVTSMAAIFESLFLRRITLTQLESGSILQLVLFCFALTFTAVNFLLNTTGTLKNIASLGTLDMYRWSGAYGIADTNYRGWFYYRRIPIFLLLFILVIVPIFLTISSPLIVDIYYSIRDNISREQLVQTASLLGFGGFGFTIIFSVIALWLVGRSLESIQTYRRKLIDLNHYPIKSRVFLDYSPQDESFVTPIREELSKYHHLVGANDTADINLIFLSTSKTSFNVNSSATIIPIMLEGVFSMLDTEALELQIVDWRKGIIKQNTQLLARFIDNPAQLVVILGAFPRKIEADISKKLAI